jgi:hypothetical protein
MDPRAILYVGCGDNVDFYRYVATKFPRARVTAIDVQLPVVMPGFICMDARLPGVGRMLPDNGYDIIIDDVRDADYTIYENLLPYVNAGGMYIIEYVNVKEDAGSVATSPGFDLQVYDYLPLNEYMVEVIIRSSL